MLTDCLKSAKNKIKILIIKIFQVFQKFYKKLLTNDIFFVNIYLVNREIYLRAKGCLTLEQNIIIEM